MLTLNISIELPAEGLEPTRSCDHWILSRSISLTQNYRCPVSGLFWLGVAKFYSATAQSQLGTGVSSWGTGVRSSHLTLAVKACSMLVWPGHCGLNLAARFII